MADAIEMAVLCKEMNCLPRAGGLKDQDARDVWLMQVVIQAIEEKAALDKRRQGPSA